MMHRVMALLFFVTSCVMSADDGLLSMQQDPRLFMVRVLLDSKKNFGKEAWTIGCSHGIVMTDTKNPRQKIRFSAPELHVHTVGRHLYLNKKTKLLRTHIKLDPVEGRLTFDGNEYEGSFIVLYEKGTTYLINMINIDDYIYSVLRWESWPGWPLEVNKAFAIMCRSYVLAQILDARKTKKPYHIKKSNLHQTYNGYHGCNTLRDAVAQTHNVFLAYDGRPIVAMYDCCCGGVIPADVGHIDFEQFPYLKRTYPCTFCSKCKLWRWRLQYNLQDVTAILKEKHRHITHIKDIAVTKVDKAGLVKEVVVKHGNHTLSLTGKNVYSLFKDIKSFAYTVGRKADTLLFEGQGYGHHLGVCQWGARQMVREGWNYKRILQFYYPNTELMRLQVA